jgi:hypothetical protein
MPRQATGELEKLADGGFAARITITGRTRRQFALATGTPGANDRGLARVS